MNQSLLLLATFSAFLVLGQLSPEGTLATSEIEEAPEKEEPEEEAASGDAPPAEPAEA